MIDISLFQRVNLIFDSIYQRQGEMESTADLASSFANTILTFLLRFSAAILVDSK